MNNKLLTAGEFAKLSRTTKRTITFYDEKNILKPKIVSSKGIRYYFPEQIIDFQVVLLLRKLNFSLDDIRAYLIQNKSLKELFNAKKEVVELEILNLKRSLKTIESYYYNLDKTGTLIQPEIKEIKPFEIYYIAKQGNYANIKDYCLELKSCFKKIPQEATFLTIFEHTGYQPKNAQMKIGVIVTKDMILHKTSKVELQKVNPYKALAYTHHGSGKLLSLLWKSLNKYRKDQGIKVDPDLYDREFYNHTSLNGEENEDCHIFEIQIPIIG